MNPDPTTHPGETVTDRRSARKTLIAKYALGALTVAMIGALTVSVIYLIKEGGL